MYLSIKHLIKYCIYAILLNTLSISAFSNDIKIKTNIDSLLIGENDSIRFGFIIKEIKKYNYDNLPLRLKYSKYLLELAKKLNTPRYKANAYYELAYSYEIIGQIDLALEAGFEAIEYAKIIGDKGLIALTFNEIGMIYSSGSSTKDFDIAIEYFRKFLSIQLALKDTGEIAGAYSNIGLMYFYQNISDSALYYARKALKLRQAINQERGIAISLDNIGESLLGQGMLDSAFIYLSAAEQANIKLNNIYGLNEAYSGIIKYYLKKKDFVNAKKYVDIRCENSKKINSKFITKAAYYSKYTYYREIGNFEKALEVFEMYKLISDSVRNDRINDKIANLQAVYDLNEKEKEIELFKEREATQAQIAKNRQQRFIYLLILSILIILVFVIISLSLLRKRKQQKRMHDIEIIAHEREKELANSELEKSQLKEQELNTQLEYKSKQLTSHALNMMKKNKFLGELENDISEIRKEASDDVKAKLRRINSLIKRNNKSDKDWELFKNYFEEVNKGFYERLNEKFPGLSSNDYKLCALVKLNMNIKESASVLNISPESVKTARYRLRKKLEMKAEVDLHEFIARI